MSSKQTENKTAKNETETAVAPAMPVGTVEVHGESVSGEICKSDLQIPSLKLVQQVGDLGELFTPGSFVLNNEHAVSDGTVETTITVAHWNKYYIENLEYGTDQTPDTAKTMQEVVQKGGTTEWQGKPLLHGLLSAWQHAWWKERMTSISRSPMRTSSMPSLYGQCVTPHTVEQDES
jgi:hypothetical protein